MEAWDVRFREEYQQLVDRITKLNKLIVKYKADTLDFKPKCKLGLLSDQLEVMNEYKHILEVRAEIEGVDIWD